MTVLVAGGAGKVGGILRPALEARWDCRYLDVRPVPGAEDRTTVGSVADPAAVAAAAEGCQAIVQLAMAHWRSDPSTRVDLSYDVHVKGMHRLLEAAVANGARLVYASTMSIYEGWGHRPEVHPTTEEMTPDSAELYGLTKRLAEEVAAAFCRRWPELRVVSLRLVHPLTEEEFAAPDGRWRQRGTYTAPEDLRRAFCAALERDLPPGFHPVQIMTDPSERMVRLQRARELLGWEPADR